MLLWSGLEWDKENKSPLSYDDKAWKAASESSGKDYDVEGKPTDLSAWYFKIQAGKER